MSVLSAGDTRNCNFHLAWRYVWYDADVWTGATWIKMSPFFAVRISPVKIFQAR